MNKKINILTVIAVTSSLFVTGCSSMSPAQQAAIAGVVGGGATAIVLATTGVKSDVTIPVSLGVAALSAGTTYIIAKNQANAEQKRLAQERARNYYSNLSAEQKKSLGNHLIVKTSKTPGTKGDSVMMYDIKNDQVTDTVYAVKSVPAVGEKSTIISSTPATYIGIGS